MTPQEDLLQQATAWLAQEPDAAHRAQLHAWLHTLQQSDGDAAATAWQALRRCFASRLPFGTAGLRGPQGPGPAQFNRLVVRQTSAGLLHWLQQQATYRTALQQHGVVIGYDARLGSATCAADAAGVLLAAGYRVHLSPRPVPTPVVAFAVRQLQAAAAIVITASHNPAADNGYKVYLGDGTPLRPPDDAHIAVAIAQASLQPVACVAVDGQALCQLWSPHLEELYLQGVAQLLQQAAAPSTPSYSLAARQQLRLAYSPLHGVGGRWACRLLEQAGFRHVFTVASQSTPNGHFPGLPKPNPEEAGVMTAVIALAQQQGAQLACANDPDADRLAVAIPTRHTASGWQQLHGDALGLLLAESLLHQARPHSVMLSTFVSSRLLARLCAAHGIRHVTTLTGFKWLSAAAQQCMERGETFLFGYEEALGYRIGNLVADKDGLSALVVLASYAAMLHAQGSSLEAALEALYRRYGLVVQAQRSYALRNPAACLQRLRAQPYTHLAQEAVVACEDLAQQAPLSPTTALAAGVLPRCDVLKYTLASGTTLLLRPSGTEPKLKCYYEVESSLAPHDNFAEVRQQAQQRLDALLQAHALLLQRASDS